MVDSNRDNDSKLVDGLLEGDEQAFKDLFLKYYDPLCNFVWRFTRSKAVSEDLVQDVFTNIWTLRTTLDTHIAIRVYLYQAVKNKALDYIKHQKVVRESVAKFEYHEEKFITQKTNLSEASDFIVTVRKAIDNLPDRACQVYKLHREDGLTYREISEVMSISVKTVESQMTRALNILRKGLGKYFPLQVTEETLTRILK